MKNPPSSDESLPETPNQSSSEGIGSDPHPTEQMTVKVCPRCSVQSQTTGNFCPQCAAPYSGPQPRRKISKRIVVGVVAALVVAGSATGLALKVSHDNQALSPDEYYQAMKVGKFAAMSHEELDKVGQGLCSDLKNLEPSKRPLAVIVIKQSTDTEQEAFEAGKAMTGRWCPEYVGVFKY
jgi:hypothetical protein